MKRICGSIAFSLLLPLACSSGASSSSGSAADSGADATFYTPGSVDSEGCIIYTVTGCRTPLCSCSNGSVEPGNRLESNGQCRSFSEICNEVCAARRSTSLVPEPPCVKPTPPRDAGPPQPGDPGQPCRTNNTPCKTEWAQVYCVEPGIPPDGGHYCVNGKCPTREVYAEWACKDLGGVKK